MKQVGRYSKFLFSIIFRRWSYYVSSLVYLLVLIAVLFLVSAVLKEPVSITLMYYGFNMMVVLAGAIVAAIYAVQLFRAGIDDGTELLVTAKPIKRNQMLAGKCIVLFTLILLLSLLSMCFGFLTYFTVQGDKTYTYVGGGVFLTTFLILLFFSGVALVFCLVTKKMGATLATIGTCFVFMLYCFADTILSTGPAKYVQNKNVGMKLLNPVTKVLDESNGKDPTVQQFQSVNGAIATNNLTNTAISAYKNSQGQLVPANSDYLANLWHDALLGSSRYSMLVVDPIFQWSVLMNLQNYIVDDFQGAYFYNYIFTQDSMTNGNLKFGKKAVDLDKFMNWDLTPNIKKSDQNIKYLLLENKDFTFQYYTQIFQMPNLVDSSLDVVLKLPAWNPTLVSSKPSDASSQGFSNQSIDTSSPANWPTLNQFFFEPPKTGAVSSPAKAITTYYQDEFQTLAQANIMSNMNRTTTISYLQSYLNQAIFESFQNPTVLAAFQAYLDNHHSDLKLVDLTDFKSIAKLLDEDPKSLMKELLFVNKVSLSMLKQIQRCAFEFVSHYEGGNYQESTYINAMHTLGVNSLIPTIVTSYPTFVVPNGVVQELINLSHDPHILTQPEVVRHLAKITSLSYMLVNQPPLVGMDSINFATFNSVEVVPYLSLGGVLGVWFSLTAILLVIGTILYARKDFI